MSHPVRGGRLCRRGVRRRHRAGLGRTVRRRPRSRLLRADGRRAGAFRADRRRGHGAAGPGRCKGRRRGVRATGAVRGRCDPVAAGRCAQRLRSVGGGAGRPVRRVRRGPQIPALPRFRRHTGCRRVGCHRPVRCRGSGRPGAGLRSPGGRRHRRLRVRALGQRRTGHRGACEGPAVGIRRGRLASPRRCPVRTSVVPRPALPRRGLGAPVPIVVTRGPVFDHRGGR